MTEQNVNIEPDDVLDTGQDVEPEGNPEVEDQARRYGWKPREEWVGDDTNWRDAESFMQQGHIVAKTLEEKLTATERAAEERIERMERESAERFARLEGAYKQAAELRKKNHERDVARIKAEMRAAVEDGDTAKFEALQADRDALDAERDTFREEPPKPNGQDGKTPPEGHKAAFQEWVTANPWFNTDPELNGAANGYFAAINGNGKDIRENLHAVTERMKEIFPQKFGGETQRHAKVDSGGLAGGRAGRKKGIAELPAEAKAAGKQFVAEGLYASLDEYAKDYWEQEV